MKALFILPLIVLFNCSSHKNTQAEESAKKNVTPHPIKFTTLVQSALHGAGDEGIEKGLYVIKDKKQWEAFLSKMNKVNDETKKFKTTDIDFKRQMLLAVFDPVLGTGGVKINIDKIIETPDKVQVLVSHTRPKGFATTVMNQPYHIVVLPKIDKEFEMKVVD